MCKIRREFDGNIARMSLNRVSGEGVAEREFREMSQFVIEMQIWVTLGDGRVMLARLATH